MKKLFLAVLLLCLSWLAAAQTPVYKNYLGYSIDFATVSGVPVIGYNNPVPNRAVLEAIERDLILQSFPDFNTALFRPRNIQDANTIQLYRQAHWATINGKKVREQELILTKGSANNLELFGGKSAIEQMIAHYKVLGEIWNTTKPAVSITPRLNRIIVVSNDVASKDDSRESNRDGWQVLNDEAYSFWANDEFSGLTTAKGDIPYDIDSRWMCNETWAYAVYNGGLGYVRDNATYGCKIDYGLLHELTHHIPVGDNYVYNPGGGSLNVPIGNGSTLNFGYATFQNDHMSDPTAPKLTAVSSYAMMLFHKINPQLNRNPQKSEIVDYVNQIYGWHFFDNLTIKIDNLEGLKLDNVYMTEENGQEMVISSDVTSQSFDGKSYTLTLNRAQQDRLFPGFQICMKKGNVVLPIAIPRIAIESLVWRFKVETGTAPASYTWNIGVKSYAANVLKRMEELAALNSNEGNYFNLSMYNTSETVPANIFASAPIDTKGNVYAVEFVSTNKKTLVNLLTPKANESISTSASSYKFKTWVSTSATSVKFVLDNQNITAVSEGNGYYSYSWTPTPGNHTLKAVAVNGGVSYSSELINFNVGAFKLYYTVLNEWNTGFEAKITIKNESTTPIYSWTLSFNQDDYMYQYWNCQMVQNGPSIQAINAAWNGTILPGQSVSLGYLGNKIGALSIPATGIFNGNPVTFINGVPPARTTILNSESLGVSVHPNPTSSTLIIPAEYHAEKISITNGLFVQELQAEKGEMSIDVSGLMPGIYEFKIEGEDGVYLEKILIQR